MARSALIRVKFRPRRRHFTPPGAIHFTGSLALAQTANTASIGAAETFVATLPVAEANASVAIAGLEIFSEYLSLAAPANQALINEGEITTLYPGSVVIGDAAGGGLLGLMDQAAYGLAANDAALYDVQISESV